MGKEAEDRLSHSLLFHTKAKTDFVILGARSEFTGTVEPKYQNQLLPSIHATNVHPQYNKYLSTFWRDSCTQDLYVARLPF